MRISSLLLLLAITVSLNSFVPAGQTFGFSAYMGVLPNQCSLVFGIDESTSSAWDPAFGISSLLGKEVK